MKKKRLIDRTLYINLIGDKVTACTSREDAISGLHKMHFYNNITPTSLYRMQTLINQPTIDPVVTLLSGTLEYYFLRNIEIDMPEVSEPHDEKVEVNGQTYQIPY